MRIRQIVPGPKRNGQAGPGFMEELLGMLHNPVARIIAGILRAIREGGISVQPDFLNDVKRYGAGPHRQIQKGAAMKLVEMEQQKPDTIMAIRQEDIAAVKESMERGLEKGFKYFGWNTTGDGVLWADSLYCIQSKEVAENFCWNPDLVNMPSRAVRLSQVYNALAGNLRQLAATGESPALVNISLDGIEKIDPLKSRRQYNYNDLKQQLVEAGPWNSSVSDQLIKGMLKNSGHFEVALDARANGEPFGIRLHFTENNAGRYVFSQIGLTGIKIDHKEIAGIHTADIEDLLKKSDYSKKLTSVGDFRRLSAILRMAGTVEGDPEGKAIVEKLILKYIPGALPPGREAIVRQSQTAQSFPVGPDFRLTVEQAFNLYSGRAAYIAVPGKNSQEAAWFRLDPAQKDARGNALLLQYAPQYNYNLPHVLKDLPLQTTAEKPLMKLVLELYAGNFSKATLLVNNQETPVRLLADPLHRSVGVYTPEGRPFAPALAQAFIPPMPSVDKEPAYPYLYAYDSDLKKQAYFPDLGGQQSTDINRKEALLRSLNTPDPPAAGKGQKKQ